MVIEARERIGWVNHWAQNFGPTYQGTVVPSIDRFKDPNLSPDRRATASQIIRRELDRALSDSLPIPRVIHGPMGRSRDLGISCGMINIRRNNGLEPITGEAVYLKHQGFAVFGEVLRSRPLIFEARREIASGDSLLEMMEAWQIRELARRVFVKVARMNAA